MEICRVGSMADLVNLYWEKDSNKNGKLEQDEFPEAIQGDKNSDKALSPWEAMEAANKCGAKPVFNRKQISQIRSLNDSGKTFPPIKLAVKNRLQGSDWPAGTEFNFGDNGEISSWSMVITEKKSKIKIVCEGAYDSARLKQGAKINGIDFAPGAAIWFDKENRVKGVVLAEDAQIGKYIYKSGTSVEFYPDGKMQYGVLAKETDLGPGLFPAGTEVAYDESGRLLAVRLPVNEKVAIQGKIYTGPKKATLKNDCFYVIRFHNNGNVLGGPFANNFTNKSGVKIYSYLSDNAAFSGTNCNITDKVFISPPFYAMFYEDGTVKRANVAEDTVVNVKGIKFYFKKHAEIEYYENGINKNGKLASKTELYGIPFEPGTPVELDLDGKVIRIISDKVVYEVDQNGKLKTSPRK